MSVILTVKLKYNCGHEEKTHFTNITLAARFAEGVVLNNQAMIRDGSKHLVSVLLQGPDGEREFITQK